MARKYAGIMALIGMTTIMLRALKSGSELASAVPTALGWLCAFGAVGWLVGMIAESTIAESVRARLEEELAAMELAAMELAQESALGSGTESEAARPV